MVLFEEGDVVQRNVAVHKLEDHRLCQQVICVLRVGSVVFPLRQPLRYVREDHVQDLDDKGVDELEQQPSRTPMEDVTKHKEHHDHEDEHDDCDREHGITLHHLPDSLLPRIVPVHPASHRIDAACADEFRPGGFQLPPHPQRAPLQRILCRKSAPEVDEERGPEAHAYAHEDRRGVVGRPHDEVNEPQEHTSDGRNSQPLVEVRHEQKVQRDSLPEVIADLVNVRTPSKCLEPILVQVNELPVFVQGEVVPELGIVEELPHVHRGAVVVLLPDYVIDELDPVSCPKNGTRLRVRTAAIIVCLVNVVLVDVGDDTPVTVVQLPPAGVVVVVRREGREVLRLELELVLPHLGDLPQVLLVGSNPEKDLVTIS
mmetsp:Transcript_1492/g.4448  ORF Transcript_1492/g.4448 Transcript_1492/m.4448 type:complete len:371 (+) Transcript_1492:990-2102(+)